MSKPQSKKQAQIGHARRRARERYGIHFHQDLCNRFVQKIRKSSEDAVYGQANALFVVRDSGRVTIWVVQHEDAWYPVCYDKERKTIITFLPIDFMRTETAKRFAERVGRKIEIDDITIRLEEDVIRRENVFMQPFDSTNRG